MSEPMTRGRYLFIKGCQAVMGDERMLPATLLISEAVASTAMEHPEWDMDEERTWDEWEGGEL